MPQRISDSDLERALDRLSHAFHFPDGALGLSMAYGGNKVVIYGDKRGTCQTCESDFLNTGYVSKRELYAAMNAASEAMAYAIERGTVPDHTRDEHAAYERMERAVADGEKRYRASVLAE